MAQSFGIVEDKLHEADFFLEKLRSSQRLTVDARCYFSAFVSAARSVTLALQATMRGVPDFEAWYEGARDKLKADPLAPFFVEIRNDIVHTGLNPLNQVGLEHLLEHLRDDLSRQMAGWRTHTLVLPDVRSKGATVLADAVEASTSYFTSLVDIVFACYERFICVVDPKWYFTHANFVAMGRTLEDALRELGFPPDWISCAPADDQAWRVLRSQQPGNQLNDLFEKYVGRQIPGPDDEEKSG